MQKWNQPRKKRLPPKRISELHFSIESHGKKKKNTDLKGREPSEIVGKVSEADKKAIIDYKSRLALSKKNCNRLSIQSVLRGTSPVQQPRAPPSMSSTTTCSSVNDQTLSKVSLLEKRINFKQKLNKTEEERLDIFNKTKEQSECELWFKEREERITGSNCGKIINRNQNIYPKTILKALLSNPRMKTAAMVMGKQQESLILVRYLHHQHQNGHPDLMAHRAGFLVDKEHGWLGASPDAVVEDGQRGKGCAELKAAVAHWEKTLLQAATSSSNFCLCFDSVTNTLQLKTKHTYYHQCQLQLFVGRDMFEWLDFVIATKNDIFIQRITLDMEWVSRNVQELACFYDSFVLPKLVMV